MKFPWMMAPALPRRIPCSTLAAMTLPSPAPVPPILRLFEPLASIPSLLGIGSVPVTSVPIRFPWTTAFWQVWSRMAFSVFPEMMLPWPAPLPPTMTAALLLEQLTPMKFPIATVPVASTPMELPRTVPPELALNWMALDVCAERMLRSPAFGPPMTFAAEPLLKLTPMALPRATVPDGSVPRREPSSVRLPPEVLLIAVPHRLIASALIVTGVEMKLRHCELKVPSWWISICGVPAKPGCVVPSIVRPASTLTLGRLLARAIVCGPVPGMLNAIVCGPAAPLASVSAWRSDPAPASAMVVTVYVVAESAATQAKPRPTTR